MISDRKISFPIPKYVKKIGSNFFSRLWLEIVIEGSLKVTIALVEAVQFSVKNY